ncbi:sugar phosphate isomerase/epimerase family protein [Rubrimonas cliftonensis]|uniref:Sugar phosphate isomerase/epimerase n=1 Tax=Rubrimonas cliftonensis TaxID=89524 RepID=A0A1H4CM93_9RHOB|nr:sugar phosphate isomerase/epimerase [Rubrimonas cliftonensis]SEA61457.1 Sugar phosphate isomerase/epimerase [Rubrimonas cliftonensis]
MPHPSEPTIDAIGLNTTGLPDCRIDMLDAVLRDFRAHGCDHVELVARRLDLVIGGRIHAARVDAVAAALGRSGLGATLHAHHAINLMDRVDPATHRAAAEASVSICAKLGVQSMVIHSGVAPRAAWEADAAGLLADERDAFRRLGDLAGATGVRLAVENMIVKPEASGLVAYGAHPGALAGQLAAIDHPAVGATLDFGHAWLSAPVLGFDYLAELEALSPWVWHLHLHDNFGRVSRAGVGDAGDEVALGLGDMHAPMFLGSIPWLDVLPRMRFRPGTKGMIELNWRFMADAPKVVATARAFAAFLDGGPAPRDPFAAST